MDKILGVKGQRIIMAFLRSLPRIFWWVLGTHLLITVVLIMGYFLLWHLQIVHMALEEFINFLSPYLLISPIVGVWAGVRRFRYFWALPDQGSDDKENSSPTPTQAIKTMDKPNNVSNVPIEQPRSIDPVQRPIVQPIPLEQPSQIDPRDLAWERICSRIEDLGFWNDGQNPMDFELGDHFWRFPHVVADVYLKLFGPADLVRSELLSGIPTRFNQREQETSPRIGLPLIEKAPINQMVLDSLTIIQPYREVTNNSIYIHSLGGIWHARNLVEIEIQREGISDLTPLIGLKKLQTVALPGNRVEDISPLLSIPSLTQVDITRNPLNSESRDVYLPELVDRGIHFFRE